MEEDNQLRKDKKNIGPASVIAVFGWIDILLFLIWLLIILIKNIIGAF